MRAPEQPVECVAMMRWINIHIPKCAGTTFTSVLKAAFGDGFGDGRSYLSDRNFKYSSDQVGALLRCFTNLRCFSDHKLSVTLPWDEFPIRALAFVRDPAGRFVSHYRYCRAQAQNGVCFDEEASALELDDYIAETLERNPQCDLLDGQCFHLFGRPGPFDFETLEGHLASGRLLLFPLESFADACIYLEEAFPETFTDASYLPMNASPGALPVAAEQKDRIRKRMVHDARLHSLARSWFARALRSRFAADRELEIRREQFRARCDGLARLAASPVRKWRRRIAHRILPRGRVELFLG